ncbi:hypothetical protein KUTeg_009801 [Tegillarca granosa]|uniref:Uncharacterized protein n=1 Tax=Tegillarca granosa TaxID=220873 RepID=A0ABQ9F4X6_TEGGR|nr:hypothetical protein KUTeg_009801 [Tegillarca granosa]
MALQYLRKQISEISKEIDPVEISTKLKKRLLITDFQHESILCLFNAEFSRDFIWSELFRILEKNRLQCKTTDIFQILEECGYSSIALKLRLQHRQELAASQISSAVQKLDSQSSISRQNAQKLYINLKSFSNSDVFREPRTFLRSLAFRTKTKFEAENCVDKKRNLADRYAALICAEIDAHAMLFHEKFPTHGLLNELKQIVPQTTNPFITNVSFNAQMGITYAIMGEIDKADEHLKQARASSHNIEQCVEMDHMFYILVFSLICEYEKHPTSDLRDKIMEMADIGLQCSDNDEEDIKIFWRRTFFLRMIHCLLGISCKGAPILGSKITSRCIEKAKNLLAEVDKYWNTLESRRKVWYYVARARVQEIEKNYDSARAYLQNAIQIATDGNFGELPYITTYLNDLQLQCTKWF